MTIEVVEYDPAWPGRFAETATPIRRELGDVALRIDHIGSTAIPRLAAKPVIDVQIAVGSFEPLDGYRRPLEALGYVFQPDNPERTKRYFREPPGTPRTHVHVRVSGSFSQQLPLLFRDFVRAHPAVADEYAALKRELAARHADDRQAYTDAKDPFVWRVLRDADAWAQATGWQPGPSDA
jgi:GrpB-like predicted nucleotidyltransferase (UPF0157 family)